MDNSLYALLSGQVALRRKMDTIANNMANINTVGFKQEKVQFEDVFKRLDTYGGGTAFVQDTFSHTDFKTGPLVKTDNPLDIAVSDTALLSVIDDAGNQFYTKDGRLSRNAEGLLVLTSNGMKLADDGGSEIALPPDAEGISIAADGTISVKGAGALARIGLFSFDKHRINHLSDGLFKADTPLEASETGRVTQGFLENSNVNSVQTLTDMIEVQRAYEMSMNLMNKEDERIKDAIMRLGRSPR